MDEICVKNNINKNIIFIVYTVNNTFTYLITTCNLLGYVLYMGYSCCSFRYIYNINFTNI